MNKEEFALFRKEALTHRKVGSLGKVIMVTPISFAVWTIAIFLIALTIYLSGNTQNIDKLLEC